MGFDSRASVPFDTNNLPYEVQNGVVIPAGTSGFLSVGTDAGTARIILLDGSGRQIVVGAAVDGAALAGNPVRIGGSDGAALIQTLRVGVVGVTATPTGYANDLPMGRFLTVRPTLANGEFQHLMMDSTGRLLTDATFSGGTVSTIPQVAGVHGNAWDAVAVLANGVSNSIDLQYTPFVSIFGNANGETIITTQYSQDNVAAHFYDGDSTVVPGGGSDFLINVTVGARYLRLKSSKARTITATIAAKD